MKKSKIIVPAMAMIAFTSLASIAGSVAWFTASRQVTVEAGTYAVVKTTTNLECVVSQGAATAVNNNVVSFGGKLTDGSFNHDTRTIWTPNEEGTGLSTTYPDGISLTDAALETKLKRADLSETVKVYTAVTFKLQFTISFGATSGDYGLYLKRDNTGNTSKFEITTNAAASTGKGFRMAIVPDSQIDPVDPATTSTRKPVVFAGLQTAENCRYILSKADAANPDYFSGKEATTDPVAPEVKPGTAYSGGLVASDFAEGLPTDNTARADAIAMNNCLGHFAFYDSSRVTLNYIVVAWFEGTDPEIHNRELSEDYQSVKSTLVFEAVKLKPAP